MKNRSTTIETIATEERRKTIAKLLQGSLTETEIARRLGVNKSTITRDIQALKQQATRFVYDLAKQDLAYFYKSTIDDINRARTEAWKIYNQQDASNGDIFHQSNHHSTRDKLNALKIIIQANMAAFELLQAGPTVLSIKALEERVSAMEKPTKQEVMSS